MERARFRSPRPGGPSGNDPRLGYIYYEKISDDVYLALKESGLASTDDRGERWIGMHPRLAWVYMTALAEQIAAGEMDQLGDITTLADSSVVESLVSQHRERVGSKS